MKLKKSIAITLSTLMFMSVTVSNVSASSSYESKASNQLEWN